MSEELICIDTLIVFKGLVVPLLVTPCDASSPLPALEQLILLCDVTCVHTLLLDSQGEPEAPHRRATRLHGRTTATADCTVVSMLHQGCSTPCEADVMSDIAPVPPGRNDKGSVCMLAGACVFCLAST